MKIIKSIDVDFWWQVARDCPYATFFHTPLWHQLASRSYPECIDASIGAITDDQVNIIFPLLKTRMRLIPSHHYISTFSACYGGPIADGPIKPAHIEALLKAVPTTFFTQFRLITNPLQPFDYPHDDFTVCKQDFTHILKLDTDFETIFSNFTKGHRSGARKGSRLGVSVRIAQDLADYQSYFEVYLDTLERWGDKATSEYPWSLFENGYKLYQTHQEQLKLWVAELDGKMIAGAWVFYWNQHIDWWHGAALSDYFKFNANNVLQTKIIEDAIEHGYRYYDFNPSGGHEGVARSKKHYGAEEWPLTRYWHNSRFQQVAKQAKAIFKK